jgi:hypothetical protein
MVLQMRRKPPQHLFRPALGIHRRGQVGVEAPDGRRHRPRGALRPVAAQPGTRAQALRHLFQLAQRLGLHRLDLVPVLQDALQLALVAPQGPHGRRVLQPHEALLQDFLWRGRLSELLPGLQRQRYAVHRLARLQQQAGDVQRAQLVFEDGFPALKPHRPVFRASAQGILALAQVLLIRRLRVHLFVSSVWPVTSCHRPKATAFASSGGHALTPGVKA